MTDLPDWYAASVLTGWNGTQHRTLKVLETGELYAMLKCKYDELIKDVKGDINGNLTLNLHAQDLAELINRPKYGAAKRIYNVKECVKDVWRTLFEVSSKGMTYGGWIYDYHGLSDHSDEMQLYVDNEEIPIVWERYHDLLAKGLVTPYSNPFYLELYDEATPLFLAGIMRGITFESSISVRFRSYANTHDVNYALYYALV